MPLITWLECPSCERHFYVEAAQLGNAASVWLCPFCGRLGTQGEFRQLTGGRNLANPDTVESVTKEVTAPKKA